MQFLKKKLMDVKNEYFTNYINIFLRLLSWKELIMSIEFMFNINYLQNNNEIE